MIDGMTIDFVIPWVDGSDPIWREKKMRYSGGSIMNAEDQARFRDWDILRYWFRAVEEYAPWVRYVFFITDNQVPDWLNIDHPKLKWIKHTDYIPAEYLPTFSSHTIELNYHRIPELSEYFVYFNDDMFLNAPVKPEDFFRKGLPCDSAVLDIFSPAHMGNPYVYTCFNDIAFLNSHFEKHQVLREHPMKWYNLKYGKKILKNIYYTFPNSFSNLFGLHIASSMLKSTYNEVWELEPELMHNTCTHKFRSWSDVNQYIFSYYNLCRGKFAPRRTNFGRCYSIEQDDEKMYDDLLCGKSKVVCVNDHPEISDFDREKAGLIAVFEKKFSGKSSFER